MRYVKNNRMIIMNQITDFLYGHLKVDQLIETFGVLCLLMTCFEARLEQKMKIPATLLSPLVKFIDLCIDSFDYGL